MSIESGIDAVKSAMPLIKRAADTIAQFTGTSEEARGNSVITDALEIIGTLAPIIDSFSRGSEVTLDQVRNSLAGMHEALSDLDEEIARQGG